MMRENLPFWPGEKLDLLVKRGGTASAESGLQPSSRNEIVSAKEVGDFGEKLIVVGGRWFSWQRTHKTVAKRKFRGTACL
jgi:hypothetical protein